MFLFSMLRVSIVVYSCFYVLRFFHVFCRPCSICFHFCSMAFYAPIYIYPWRKLSVSPGRATSIFTTTDKIETVICCLTMLQVSIWNIRCLIMYGSSTQVLRPTKQKHPYKCKQVLNPMEKRGFEHCKKYNTHKPFQIIEVLKGHA